MLLILFFDIIFAALPNQKLTLKSQLPGAAVCAAAWYIFSFGLSVYVDYFNGFSMYGSLTTIALIMLWMYFCMYIMMMCAEVNVVFNEHFRNSDGHFFPDGQYLQAQPQTYLLRYGLNSHRHRSN